MAAMGTQLRGRPLFIGQALFGLLETIMIVVGTASFYLFVTRDGLQICDGTAIECRVRLQYSVAQVADFARRGVGLETMLSFRYGALASEAPNTAVSAGVFVVSFGLLLYSLVARYRRYSTPAERSQTTWAVAGFGLYIVTAIILIFVASANAWGDDDFLKTIVGTLGFNLALGVIIQIFMGIAILRGKLWDIDVIVRRTLVYGLLSALLAGIYFGSVALLQTVITALTGQARNGLVTVVSTLAIAGLVLPLRNGLQKIIDRHFYRRKFNAEQALARFSAEMRDAVEMDGISTQLMDAVEETMQPERMVMWIQPAQTTHLRSP